MLPCRLKVLPAYGRLALTFEANQGQVDKKVKFLSRGSDYGIFFTSTEAVLQLTTADGRPTIEKSQSSVLRMKLVGSKSEPHIEGVDQLPSVSNYFTANDPKKWRTDVPNYAKVRYKDVYPGIDLIYYGNQRQLEYDFVVAPGADPRGIALSFEGTVDGAKAVPPRALIRTVTFCLNRLRPDFASTNRWYTRKSMASGGRSKAATCLRGRKSALT